ncbi:hypothetical protein ABQX22_13595 [Xanthomonas sp. WHRI 1810A]|uniref:hypothetical protein n=1 Tax=Xanthomonas sp. WHRI 1810A TaxID=3161565 RepID=UPI0032E90D39
MTYNRTIYEAGMDIDYAIELHSRHLKLYRHMKWIFSLVFLASGAAVFSNLAALGDYAKWLGAAIALCAIVEHLLGPAEKIAKHAELKREWCVLRSEKENASLNDIDRKISLLTGEDVHIVSALEVPSFNANLRRHGREELVRKIGVWEWFVSAIA